MNDALAFGTPGNPSGMMSAYGGRPGHLEARGQAPYCRWETYVTELTTTPASIEALLPEPLERVEGDPVVYLAHLEATHWLGWDGINKPYTEVGIWIPARYGQHVGVNLFHLYLDGPGANQATVATREQFGAVKTMATVNSTFTPDWTEMWSTAVEFGRPRMYVHGKYDEEVDPSTAPLGLTSCMLSVKEIPNADFTGYDVRSVVMCDWRFLAGGDTPDIRVLRGTAEVELWEPFDAFPIVEVGPSYYYTAERHNFDAFLHGGQVLADLLKGEAR